MTKRSLGILIAIVSIGLLGLVVWATKPKSVIPPRAQQIDKSVTRAEVAEHASSNDCWTIINNNAYNITGYIKDHPGGEEIVLRACGKDATAQFTTRRDGQERIGSGTPHSPNARETLERFRIGSLVD